MTVKLVALYTQPDDPDVFEQHYRDQHMPLVHAFPGLQKVETGRIIAEADGGDPGNLQKERGSAILQLNQLVVRHDRPPAPTSREH